MVSAELVRVKLGFLAPVRSTRIQVVVESPVRKSVYLERVDADDGSVLLVEVEDLERVLATEDHVVVELVRPGESGEPWAWNVGYRTEVEASNGQLADVHC